MEENKHLDITKPGLPPAKATSRQAFIDNDQLRHDPMMRIKSSAASNETTQDNDKLDSEKSINDDKNSYKDSAYSENSDINLANNPSREHKKSNISPLTSDLATQDEKPADNDKVDDVKNNQASQSIDSPENDTQLDELSNSVPDKITEGKLDTASKAFTEAKSFTDAEEHPDKEVNKGSDELPGGVIESKNNVEDQRADLVKSLVEEKTYKLPIRTMSSKNIVRVAVVLVILAVGILVAVGFLLTKNS